MGKNICSDINDECNVILSESGAGALESVIIPTYMKSCVDRFANDVRENPE